MIRIELTTAEYDWTDANVGMKRRELAIAQQRVSTNNAPTDPAKAQWRDILGARCEAAAYKWLKPVRWNRFHLDNKRLPDLHDFIDVKGVDAPHKNLMVQEDNPPEWAYLLVDATEHPFYDIVSWCWGFEAKTEPLTSRKPGRWNHFVDRGTPMMKAPHLLELVLRERQEFPERAIELAASGVLPLPADPQPTG